MQIELLWQVREQPTAPLTLSLDFRTAIGGKLAAEPALMPLFCLISPSPTLWCHRAHGACATWTRRSELLGRAERTVRATAGFPGFPRAGCSSTRFEFRIAPTWMHRWPAPVRLASFGELADLADFKLEPASPRPGEALQVTLFWQPRTETNRSYSVFVHLLDKQGQIVAQHDGIPANGTLPTNIWLSDEIIAEAHTADLCGLPAGQYDLRVGLYDLTTGQRLPVVSTQPVANGAVLLLPVEINR